MCIRSLVGWCLVLLLALGGRRAGAEPAELGQPAKLHAKPSERSKVLRRLTTGTSVNVQARKGRWLKVKVGSKTGYIQRFAVAVEAADEPQGKRRPFVRGRSKTRAFGREAPDDRRAREALGDATATVETEARDVEPEDQTVAAEPEARGRAVKPVPEAEIAETPAAAKADASFETRAGNHDDPLANDEGSGAATDEAASDDGGAPEVRTRQLAGAVRVGWANMGQTMSTIGGVNKVPDNYALSTMALRLGLRGHWLKPYKTKYWLGVELGYDLVYSMPGVAYMGSTIGLTAHRMQALGVGVYTLGGAKAMTVKARLGLHYDLLSVPLPNALKLPSESLLGVLIGGEFALGKLTPTLGARVSVDLIFGSRSQTVGLEDGSAPSASAWQLGLEGMWAWKPGWQVLAGYQLVSTSNEFGAPLAASMRGHMGTAVARSDSLHLVSVGLERAF